MFVTTIYTIEQTTFMNTPYPTFMRTSTQSLWRSYSSQNPPILENRMSHCPRSQARVLSDQEQPNRWILWEASGSSYSGCRWLPISGRRNGRVTWLPRKGPRVPSTLAGVLELKAWRWGDLCPLWCRWRYWRNSGDHQTGKTWRRWLGDCRGLFRRCWCMPLGNKVTVTGHFLDMSALLSSIDTQESC